MSNLIAYGRSLPDQQSLASRIHGLIQTNGELRYELAQAPADLKRLMEEGETARFNLDLVKLELSVEKEKNKRLESQNAALVDQLQDNAPNRRRAL